MTLEKIADEELRAGGVMNCAITQCWRPIETAPKDGNIFLVYGAARGVYRLAYIRDRWPVRDQRTHEMLQPAPTHWMPLPEPPSVQRPPDKR